MNRSELVRFARVGAEARLRELQAEREAILREFPDLRRAGSMSATGAPANGTTRRRRRRKMSAEARRRISEAQKARWAKQKARGRRATKVV